MMKVTMINVGIVLLGIVLFIVSLWLIWVNRYDEKITQIGVGILLIAIVTSFILITFQILSPLPSESKTVDVLILRKGKELNVKDFSEKLLKLGSFHKDGYGLLHRVNLFSSENTNIEIDSNIISIDLLEASLWSWLSNKYPLHWDVDVEKFEGISGGQGSCPKSADAEKNPKNLSSDYIRNLLKDSTLISSDNFLRGVSLPSGSILNIIERDKCSRIYQIKNKYIDFKINIYCIGSSGLNYTTLGENIKKTLPSAESWGSDDLKVKFECQYSKLYRGSLATKTQRKWVNEIMNDFSNDFEWRLVKPDLEKAYSSNN